MSLSTFVPSVLFPLAGNVFAAAKAEECVAGETETLAWLDKDSLIINQPDEFLLADDFKVQHRHIFVGEVRQTHINEEYVCERDGRTRIAGITELDPIIYALDNRYYKIGTAIGTGYHEGRSLIK